jgi:hypothetical protein
MQKFLALFCALLASAVAVRAQVNVEIVLDDQQFLRGEPVTGRVKISNFSGQALRVGEDPEWLAFLVTGTDGKALRALEAMPPVKPFTIGSAQTVALRMDLAPYYDLQTAGRFGVTARMKFAQLEKEFTTEPGKFDIISGVKVWTAEVGVPGRTPPVVRKFALQQAAFFKETRLYARVTEADEADLVRVVALGALPSAGRPEAAVDNSSQMHVIFQAGQKKFTYALITPEGDLIIRQTYEITGTRPRLRAEDDGRIVVSGGARKISASDLPPPPPKPETNAVVQVK